MTLHQYSFLKNSEYKIIRVLGQGGFGITYEAEQVSLGRKVAIKEFFMKDLCNRDDATSKVSVPSVGSKELVDRFKQKFIREARMIAGFDNEHIVRIHDVFEENDTAYYVMEYLPGGSLADVVKHQGTLNEPTAIDYISQIADALKYLHEQNTLHLDIKPSNVLLNQKGQLKLIDFGISKHYEEAGSQTSSTPVGISKGYAPLEQYQQGGDVSKFTPATDIYALGATLYYLVTGTVPPDASEVNEEGLPTMSGISKPLADAIEKAMSPRKKDRHQSVEAFLCEINVNQDKLLNSFRNTTDIKIESGGYDEATITPDRAPASDEITVTRDSDSPVSQSCCFAERYYAASYKRFGDYIIDIIISYVFVLVVWIIVVEISVRSSWYDHDILKAVRYLIFFAAQFFYYFILEGACGRTFGKMIFRLKVVDKDGNRPSAGRIALRTLIRFVPFESFSFLFGGEWDKEYGKDWGLSGNWHDQWSKTYVVNMKQVKEDNAK